MELGDLTILYHEGPCFVVNKPAALLTQAPPGIDSVEARMKAWIKHHQQKEGNIYLALPHRLDRPVSGALLVARHVRAARRLSKQFERRTIRKTYWACVAGRVSPRQGTWVNLVRKVPHEARAEVVPTETEGARPAELRYRVRGDAPWGTWLEVELITGRLHQIRVQAAHRGHPVLGDWMYGSTAAFGPPQEDPRLRPIALHGRRLEFLHPMTQAPVTVTAPLPATWQSLQWDFDQSSPSSSGG